MSVPELPTPLLSPYGTDEHGLICGWHFRAGAEPVALATAAQATPLLAAAGPGFIWLHMNLSHASAEAWLRTQALVGENFFEALKDGSRSTRIERDGDPCSR